MSIMIFLGSIIATKEAFRWFFIFQVVLNVASQLNVLFNFNFDLKDENKSPLTESGPEEHELQKFEHF